MNTNLLENIREHLTPKMLRHMSNSLGETQERTQNAVDESIPTVLAGLIQFSSSPDSSTQLLNLFEKANYGSLLNNLSGLLDGGNTTQDVMNAGQEILNTVFVGKLSAVRELIRTSSGVSNASASALLNIVAPIVVGVLARTRSAQGLNAAGLTTVLMNQKYFLSRLAPPGLAGVFGLRSLANLGSGLAGVVTAKELDPVRRVAVDLVKKSSTSKHWLWSVLAAGVIGLLYVGQRDGIDVTLAPLANWASAATPAGTVSMVTLPGGTVLSLKEGSFNYKVAKFLGDDIDSAVPETFVFDRLNFDFGTTRLTAESVQTVNDLSAILKAYTAVDVRLDGHTDGVGNAEDNKKLSLDRAAVVQEALIKDGIGAARVTTEGYGQEYPLASNETKEGRAKNQRLELVVLKK